MSVVRSVVVRLSANTSAYKASMSAAAAETEASAKRMSGAMARSSTESQASLHKLESTARRVGTFAGLSIAGGLIVATKAAADFAEKQTLVNTLSHPRNAQQAASWAKGYANAAMTAGKAYGYTATQVSDAEAELVKAGISTKDILGGALKGTLTLAAAGQTDVATATEDAAAAMTQFKLSGKDVPHIADLLAAGADKALGSVTDLGYGLSQAGTTAHQAHISIEETVGTLAEFAQAGLTGERGGTTFKQMLLQLETPSKQAGYLMDMLHLSLYKANGQIKSMPQLAGNMQRSFEHLTPAQRNYAMGVIFGSRAIQGANILLKDGAKVNAEWIRKVNDQGFAAHQASGKLNSLKGDLQKLKAEGQNDLIALGTGSQAPLRQLVQNITGALEKARKDGDLKKWGHEVESTLESVARVGKQVGQGLEPVAKGVGKIIEGFTKLPKGVQTAIVTGAATGYLAQKTGVLEAGKAILGKSVLPTGAAGPLGKVAGGVVPVYVTNEGFGAPGGGTGTPIVNPKPGAGGGKNIFDKGVDLTEADIKPLFGGIFGRAAGESMLGFGLRTLTNPVGWMTAGDSAGHESGGYRKPISSKTFNAGIEAADQKKAIDLTNKQAAAQATLNTLLQSPALPDYGKALRSVPPRVQTAIDTPGAVKSFSDVVRLARQYHLTPRQVATVIQLTGVAGALSGVERLQRQIAGLHDRTVTVTVAVNSAAHAAAVLANYRAAGIGGSAAGSTVPDDGGPYADRFPYLLAPKEEVVSNRHGQADRYRPVLKAINADFPQHIIRGMLADGGTPNPNSYAGVASYFGIGGSHSSSGSSGSRSTGTKKTVKKKAKKKGNPFTKNERASIDLTFDLTESLSVKTANKDIDRFALSVRSAGGHISHSLEGLKKRVDANITAYDKEAAKRDLLVESRDNTKSAVSSALGQNIFAAGGLDSAWMTPSGQFGAAIATLHANNTRSKAYLTAEKQLKAKGLKNDALGQLEANGDLATLQAFAAQSKSKLGSYQHLFNVTQGNITKASNYAGSSYAASIALSNKHLATMSHQLESLEQAVQHSAVATGKALGKELNHTASRAAHRAKTKAGRPL